MKKLFLGFILILLGCLYLQGQTVLTYEGQTYNITDNPVGYGVNVPRSVPTTFTFRNNSLTTINVQGYMLQAGDEVVSPNNGNLNGEQIIGNKFNWNGDFSGLGTSMTITHGVFTGCNIDVGIKYNYLSRVPMGIIRKSASNMVNATGGVSYNVVKTFNVGGVVKGMSNVNWYNNTFYQDRPTYSSTDPTAGTWRGAIDVYTNTDVTPNSVAHGTKIKNNIFYSKYKTLAINVMDAESLIGFECDYNVYWVEEGDHMPVFNAGGSTKTWAQWRAMGYDAHSVVMNPNFIDFVNFVPAARLNYGTDLGTAFNTGLATNATWVVGSAPATQVQNGTWQVGARVYAPATPVVLPTVTTAAISSIGTTTANSGGNVTSDGGAPVTERGVCWDMAGGPALDNPHTHDGTGTGTFTSSITGLSPNSTYYVRAYATNSAGTGYGERLSFITNSETPTAFLYVSKTNLTIPATANSDGKFNIISNTDWTVTSSQPWLTVGVELYYKLGTQGYKTQLYSGSAPDIGAFEFMQTSATGHDSAFVTLQAEANTGIARTATVTVSGTGVTPQVVNVTQEGVMPVLHVWYLAPNGNDATGDGSITKPWFTLNKAWTVVAPGHTVYMRGGTYNYLQQQHLRNKNGNITDSIRIFAYPGEKPIISRGEPYTYPGWPTELVLIRGSYISIRGLDVSGYTQKDAAIWGGMRAYFLTNSTFDRIDIHNNGGGMQLTNTDKCIIINSDFHHNQDPLTTSAGAYGNADGLGIDWLEASSLGITDPAAIAEYNQLSQDAVNYIIGCRFWYNTDDGIDDWEYEGNLYIDNCWAFWNGFIPDTWTIGGDGNGFKLGRTSISAPNTIKTRVYNSIAFQNKKWGFLDNGARCNMEIYNNTAYQNAYKGLDSWAGGFNFTTTPEAIKYYIKNNIAYGNGNDVDVNDVTNINHNTWDLPVTVTDADFKSISTLGVDGARQSNGLLPELSFLHLAESSDLRLKGVDVGLPFGGINPDLGAYQYTIKPSGYVVQGSKSVVIKGAAINLK